MTHPSDGGWVYLLVNPAWAGRVKIGRTTNLEKRLSQYQTGSPLRDYAYAATQWFPDPNLAERILLSRFHTEGEWVAVDSFFAVQALNKLKEELHDG